MGLTRVARIGGVVVATGIVAGSTLLVTSNRPTPRTDDGFSANLDGWARITAGTLAVTSLATAGVAALTRHPAVALGSLGVGGALAGAALFANSGSIGARPAKSLASIGEALNAKIHATHVPERPVVSELAPSQQASQTAAATPRPSVEALTGAKLAKLPGTPDMQLARANADKALKMIDWNRRDIVLWMPGTGSHEMSGHWIKRVAESPDHFDGGGSAVLVDYPASTDFRPSVSTGMETLRLVLAEVARRGGDHRVMLGGHSQGAWIIADAMTNPEINAAVDRAALFGKPGLAQTRYTDGHDAKVLELDDGNDPVAKPVKDRALLIDGMRIYEDGLSLSNLPTAVKAGVENADLTAFWIARSTGSPRWQNSDPHMYDSVYIDALDWLENAPERTPSATPQSHLASDASQPQ